ncbi:unnamed protein product [Camellia sinensis]
MKTCNSIWKDHKNKIETKYFKARSSDPNLKDDVPLHIVSSQWKELVKYWHTSDVEMTSKRESTDKMNVWLMTRRANDPEVIQSLVVSKHLTLNLNFIFYFLFFVSTIFI